LGLSRTEYIAICKAVALGFAVMGFIGYFVKLVSGGLALPFLTITDRLLQIHIPINNILVGGV
jgi:protein transport protein SEC61 subunit gamma-like protein